MVSRPSQKIKVEPPPEAQKMKVVVVGEQGVGKTSLCKQFAQGIFNSSEEKTIGSDFYSKSFKSSKGLIQYTLWDLSGDPTYIEVRNEFYKDSNVLIIVYDVTSKRSFDSIDMWLREVSKYSGESLPVVVVGNKSDLKGKRTVDKEEAEHWTKQRGFFGHYEISSQEGHGFFQLFNELA